MTELSAFEKTLAVIVHELKNPLSALLANVELLERNLITSASGDAGADLSCGILKRVHSAAIQMDRIISDLEVCSSGCLEKPKMRLERRDMRDILTEAIELVFDEASRKKVALKVETRATSRSVLCDPGKTVQILNNLLGNAIKFSPPELTVKALIDETADSVIVSVLDEGCGIAADELPKVFDCFWRSDRARSGGLGVGLWVAKNLVEQQGGRIYARSRPERGAEFSFALPRYSEGKANLVDGAIYG